MTLSGKKFCCIMVVLMTFLVVLSGCGNDAASLTATVQAVSGKVEIRQTAAAAFKDAAVNDAVKAGGIVKTGEESFANLVINGQVTVEIKSDSMFELEPGKDYVAQNSGMAIYKIEKNKGGFKVKSPQGVTCVLGTRFMVRILDNMTVVGVEEGKVSFTGNNGETRTVEAKQKIIADDKEIRLSPTPFDAAGDSFNYLKIDGKWVPKE